MLPLGNVLGELDFNVLLMIAGIGIPPPWLPSFRLTFRRLIPGYP